MYSYITDVPYMLRRQTGLISSAIFAARYSVLHKSVVSFAIPSGNAVMVRNVSLHISVRGVSVVTY